MKKIFSLLFVVLPLAYLFTCPSCKKTQHPTNPTPDNYRLLSYTRVINGVYPADNFTFSYDSKNRVSEIISSTNEGGPVMAGLVGKRAIFNYSNDTIYKEVTNIRTSALIERDTFIHNTSGQIIIAYFPGKIINYEYYGKLLVRITEGVYHGNATVGASRTYTSDNADFLSLNYNGQLTATFSTALTLPLAVEWDVTDAATGTTTITNHPALTNSDVLDNYKGGFVRVSVIDAATPQHLDTVDFAGPNYWTKESYGVFPDKEMRTGDYRQIGSFTMYGVNIFQGAHLTKSITNPADITDITYDIDADSKIKTTTAVIKHIGPATTTTETYQFQYETF